MPPVLGEAVTVQVSLAGSYSSLLFAASPPITKTFPLGSNVAVENMRALFIRPVSVHVPVAGLYSSALVLTCPPPPDWSDPAISTFPLGNNVAW